MNAIELMSRPEWKSTWALHPERCCTGKCITWGVVELAYLPASQHHPGWPSNIMLEHFTWFVNRCATPDEACLAALKTLEKPAAAVETETATPREPEPEIGGE